MHPEIRNHRNPDWWDLSSSFYVLRIANSLVVVVVVINIKINYHSYVDYSLQQSKQTDDSLVSFVFCRR